MEIVLAGDPVLRTPCRQVHDDDLGSADLAALVAVMTAVLREAPGVGLAANQIGLDLAVAVVEDRAEYQSAITPEHLLAQERVPVELHVLLNPELTPVGDEQVEWFEACLSLPGYTAIVPRWRRVRVRSRTTTGEVTEHELSGWHARILQHEIDHLNGRMYVDRMHTRSFMTREHYLDQWFDVPIAECKHVLGIDLNLPLRK
ncbi:MAG: Peptide deformylase, partial [Actinomycetia bacterium]|nr:Peptide deformylase [Actinomycetes bacterium]